MILTTNREGKQVKQVKAGHYWRCAHHLFQKKKRAEVKSLQREQLIRYSGVGLGRGRPTVGDLTPQVVVGELIPLVGELLGNPHKFH